MLFRLPPRLASLGLILVFSPHHSFAQLVSTANAWGVRPFESYAGDRENVNLATGNLNITIPLLSLPGRNGNKLEYAYVYNSKIWQVEWSQDPVSGRITRWWSNDNSASGIANNLPGVYSTSASDGTLICDRYSVMLPGFTNVSFSGVRTNCQDIYGHYQPGFNRYIGDDDGPLTMRVQTDGLGTDSVTLRDGMKTSETPSTGRTVDSNGNISVGSTDTLGRSVTISPAFPSPQTLSYTDSSGASHTITLNYVTQPDSPPAFSQPPDATRPTTGSSGSLSILLPTGRSYVLNFNNYGEVIKITYPAGGYTKYDYQTFVATPASASAAEDFREVVAKHVCTKATGDCTTAEELTTTYTPTITSTQSNNQFTDVRDPYLNRTRYEFWGGGRFSPREKNRWEYTGESTLLRTVSTDYDQLNLGVPTDRSQPIRVTTTLEDSNQVSKVEWDYDTYQRMTPSGLVASPIENVIEQREYDYGAGAAGPLLRRTVNTWLKVNPVNNQDYGTTAVYILNRRASETIYDGGGTLTAQTQFEYDNYTADQNHAALQASGAAQHDSNFGTNYNFRGNLTATKRWRNTDGAWLATYNQFDDAGNILNTKDPAGNTTTFSYADNFTDGINHNAIAYITQTTLPPTAGVSHIESRQYYFNTGLIAASCGENFSGATCSNTASPPQADYTTYSYDAIGRTLSIARGDGGQTAFTYNESAVPLSMLSTSSITSMQNLVNTSVVDGLARITQTQINSDPDCSSGDKTDTTYDALGRVYTVSNPYCTTSDPTYGITRYNYDPLNRVTKVISPDGTDSTNYVSTDYLGNRTTATDQAGKQRRSFSDALGRLIEVDEPGPSPGVAPTSGRGTLTVGGALQTIYSNPTQASGSVNITGTTVCIGPGNCDNGTVTITVQNLTKARGYSRITDTALSIATSLRDQFNTDASSPVTATVSGTTDNATITFTAIQAGTIGNTYVLNASASYNPSIGPSFSISLPGCSPPPATCDLSGGTDGTPIGYDAGSVTVAVGGFSTTVNYSQTLNSTLDSFVGSLTTALNGSGTTVSALRSGNSINLTSIATGQASNYSVSIAYTWDQTHFSGPSYSVSPNPMAMTGGSDGVPAGTPTLDNPFITLYTYDAPGNLTCAVQKGTDTSPFTTCAAAPATWRPRSFVYNSLSQLTSATNPESGTVSYGYDNNGNLLTKIAPAPNQTGSASVSTTYSYDALNRLTQKSYSDATPVVKFGYDGVAPTGCTLPTLTINNGIGKRTGMCDAAGAEAWSYDITSAGWKITDKRTTNGITKTTIVQNNLAGSVSELTYPSGRRITYTPNGAGRMISAIDTANTINYATGGTYAPQGALSTVTLGQTTSFTGINLNQSFNKRLQPNSIRAWSTNGIALDLAYCFYTLVSGACPTTGQSNNNGNVTLITNNRDITRSQNFSYDGLNRLATVQTQTAGVTIPNANCWGLTFGYDVWGNLLSSTISGPAGCGEPLPINAPATVANQISGYCYDAAGNLLDQAACPPTGPHAYAYNAENQLTATSSVPYTYDGDGRRVQKSNGKLYWYGMGSDPLDETDLAGNTNNAAFNEYVFFNGQRVARRDSANNVSYYFADHLGTARVVTNAVGTILDDSDFYPFGGERPVSSSSGNTYKFTSKERDESGLDNFGARYNSSNIARFISADPISIVGLTGDIHDPQSWNSYAYVRNNSTNLIDPTGELYCKSDSTQLACITDDEYNKHKDRYKDYKPYQIIQTVEVKGKADRPKLPKGKFDFVTSVLRLVKCYGTTEECRRDAFIPIGPPALHGLGLGGAAASEGRVVIGKLGDLAAEDALAEGETVLKVPKGDPGAFKANWAVNASKLRQAMAEGRPIRDLSVDAQGNLANNTGFLRAERNLLLDHGWTFSRGYWYPPTP